MQSVTTILFPNIPFPITQYMFSYMTMDFTMTDNTTLAVIRPNKRNIQLH